MENYTTLDADNELAYDRLDGWLAETTGAVVDDLPETMRNVVYHAYGLISHVEVWRYDAVLVSAKLEVRAGLRRRGVWLGE